MKKNLEETGAEKGSEFRNEEPGKSEPGTQEAGKREPGTQESVVQEPGNQGTAKQPVKILGLPLSLYLIVFALTSACMVTGCVPDSLVPAFLVLMVFGAGFDYIGNHVPIVRTYLGGSVICILGSAVVQSAGLLPQQTYDTLYTFVNESGFLIFYIAALITGSLFNIDRNLLLRATVKLLPVAFLSLAVGILLSGLLGLLQGEGFWGGILYIGVPMTSGGMTAGTVPLSAMYSQALGVPASEVLTKMAPATVLGNCVAIVLGGLANNFGNTHPALTGGGMLVNDGRPVKKTPPMKPTFALLCTGMVLAFAFYQLGALLHRFIPIIPTYAWMIIAVVLVKGTGIMSAELEDAAREWGQFAIHSWTAAALTGIGFTLIDLNTILKTLTPLYLISVILIVGSITLTAAALGKLVGFYPVESAIAAGMCTTNMGGSGNVAVLSSAHRMELLPFAQIVTRTCGALMLTLGGILVQLVG